MATVTITDEEGPNDATQYMGPHHVVRCSECGPVFAAQKKDYTTHNKTSFLGAAKRSQIAHRKSHAPGGKLHKVAAARTEAFNSGQVE